MSEVSEDRVLQVAQDLSLSVTNHSLRAVAKKLHWLPETAVRRIQAALPAILEQQIYLAVAPSFGILPESLDKLLRMYLGHEQLELDDLEPHPIGKNLIYSRFNGFAAFLRESLNLLRVIAAEYPDFSLTIEHAGNIVLNYGTDAPELLIEMVDSNLEPLCEVLGLSNKRSYAWRMRTCVWVMAEKIIPRNQKNGIPDILDVSDFMAMASEKRNQLRAVLGAELPDYLADDVESLRCCPELEFLRSEGVLNG